MLGDITRTLQNLSDHDPKLAKAIDDYLESQMMMMRACDAASQRIQQGQAVTAGKVTADTEALSQLVQSMTTLAEQALAATCANTNAASSFLYMKRRRVQGVVLELQKGGGHD